MATDLGPLEAAGGDPDAERAFVERLRTLDSEAWGELYDRHHARIWRYIFGRSGDRDLADDVAAQVFVEALESIGRFRYRGKPVLAWLYTIARNQAAKRLRARRHEVQAAVEPTGGSPEDRLESFDLASAVRGLTGGQREVLALRFYAGLTTREIAAALGKSEAAIYSIEVRAIGALRRQLAPEGERIPGEADEFRPPTGIQGV